MCLCDTKVKIGGRLCIISFASLLSRAFKSSFFSLSNSSLCAPCGPLHALSWLVSFTSSLNPSHRVPSSITEVTFSHHCLYPVGPSSHYLHTSFLYICFSCPIPPSVVISEVFGAQRLARPPLPSLSEEQEAAVSDPPKSITYSRLVYCSCIPSALPVDLAGFFLHFLSSEIFLPTHTSLTVVILSHCSGHSSLSPPHLKHTKRT